LAVLSTSVSLVSTLPLGSTPADVPASVALGVSATATGLSLAPWIVTVSVEEVVSPALSRMV
jgi:hypothetical protein